MWNISHEIPSNPGMHRLRLHQHRLRTIGLCVAVLALCIGYFTRWGSVDRVTDGGVSIVAAVAATGIVANAVSIYRDKQA